MLGAGGVCDELAVVGHQLMIAIVNGFTLDETGDGGGPPAPDEGAAMARDYVAALPPEALLEPRRARGPLRLLPIPTSASSSCSTCSSTAWRGGRRPEDSRRFTRAGTLPAGTGVDEGVTPETNQKPALARRAALRACWLGHRRALGQEHLLKGGDELRQTETALRDLLKATRIPDVDRSRLEALVGHNDDAREWVLSGGTRRARLLSRAGRELQAR